MIKSTPRLPLVSLSLYYRTSLFTTKSVSLARMLRTRLPHDADDAQEVRA